MGMLLSIHRANRTQSSCERPARHPVSNTIGNLAPFARIRRKSSRPFSPGISKSRIARLNVERSQRVASRENERQQLNNRFLPGSLRASSCLARRHPRIECDVCELAQANHRQALCQNRPDRFLSDRLIDTILVGRFPVSLSSPNRPSRNRVSVSVHLMLVPVIKVVTGAERIETRFVRHSCCRSLVVNQVLDQCFG